MRILSRYLILRFLGLFLAILCISTIAIIIVEMLLNFDEMVGDQAGLGSISTYLFLRIPSYYLRDLIPIAVFAAAFFSLGLAAHWLELTAAKAGGMSTIRIALPILLAAGGIGLASFVLNETLVIDATQGWKQQGRDGNQSISFQRGTFWYHRGRTIYNIASANRALQTLRGVTVYELSPEGRLRRRIEADRVDIANDDRWLLENATIRRFDTDGSGPSFERVAATTLAMDGSDARALMDADATTLPLRDLRQYLILRKQAGDAVVREQVLFHARLSEPVTVFALALLALPLGVRVESTRSLARPAVYGVATVATFFAARNTLLTLASEAVLPPVIGAWGGLAVFAAFGIWQLARLR